MSKTKIAKEWKELTGSEMQGINERPMAELRKVLNFEKKNRKR